MIQEKINSLAALLTQAQGIVLVCHVAPDGDTLASALALRYALTCRGKRCEVVCQDPVPELYHFLPEAGSVLPPEQLEMEPELLLAVDVADAARMGRAGGLVHRAQRVACIDHHVTNSGLGEVAVVDPGAPATGLMVLRVLDALGIPLDRPLATCLYTAISTDTGNFSFSNTCPEAFEAAARCLAAGIDLSELSYLLFRRKKRAQTLLLGRALGSLKFLDGGRLALITLTLEDFEACGAGGADTEGIVNYGIDTEGVVVAVIAQEREGMTKFSLRSRERVDVARIAASLGGGGHVRAAGVTLALPLDAAIERVLSAVRAQL